MLTLYKNESEGKLLYAEYWIEEGQVVEHTGKVGTNGTTIRTDFTGMFSDENGVKDDFLKRFAALGYEQSSDKEGYMLIVQFPMKSLTGNKRDLWLKDKASEVLSSELGWKGLGFVDGHDMGKTTNPATQYALNIYCFVIHEEIGIHAVKRVLKEIRLDYTKIKIASRQLDGDDDYILKYSAKKNDLEFYV